MRLHLAAFVLSLSVHAADFIKVTQQHDGWCLTQGDKAFFSFGATTVIPIDWPPKDREDKGHYDGVKAHGSEEAWAAATTANFTQWGLNTLGAWSAPAIVNRSPFYFAHMVPFGGWNEERLIDVWSPEYAQGIQDVAQKEVAPLANETRLLGYFTNNELPWHGAHGWPTDTNDSMLDRYLALPATAPGRLHLLAWLKKSHEGDFARFQEAFTTEATGWDALSQITQLKPNRFRIAQQVKYAWAGEVAERYFTLCEEAIHRHDKNHLILGCRFAGSGILSVIQAQARHSDVVSINRYDKNGTPPLEMFDQLYALTGKPVMITEFGWRAMENRSGLKNTHGVDVTVPTQKDRAERLDTFTRGLMARPYLLGMHWFQYHDEPTNGRFDGEDSNYGLVDQHDEPYEEVTTVFTRLTHDIQPGTWKRDACPPASTSKGWPENDGIALTTGTLAGPMDMLPKADQPSLTSAAIDNEHGALLTLKPMHGGWQCDFDNGTGWGTVPSFHLPPSTALAGAKRLRVRVLAPTGTPMRILIGETGTDDPQHAGMNEADGESFGSETILATGTEQTLILWLEDLVVRWEYGNQKGNRRLDLNGLQSIGIALSKPEQKGTLMVLGLELLP